ncbi:MAG: ATP-binding protein [Candidatus Bipolaricaulota bacterium]|nr:ATP-binding protein [Candidatus Bipolaricaulota bacterium]MDW8030873.1 ATP-binding protein [Candidatus Bipolaricaulota bacterium]
MSGLTRITGILVLYGLAIFFLLGLGFYRGIEVILVLSVPVAVSGGLWGMPAGVLSAVASFLCSLPFVPDKLLPWAGMCYIAVGGGMGLWHRLTHPPVSKRARPAEHQLFRRSLNFVYVIDADGQILEGNDRAHEVFGSPRRVWEFIHPDDQARFREELGHAALRGEAGPTKFRTISHSKEMIPVELKLVRLEQNRFAPLALEMRDLSALAELENKVREAQARYRYLIEDAIDTLNTGILLLDKDQRVIWANRTLERFFDIDRDDMVGCEVRRALGRAKRLLANPDDLERIINGSADPFIFTVRAHTTERILEYRSIPVATERYKGGRIDHFIDITEKKRLEESLHEKTKRLEEKNQQLEQFTHVVSHDLKEPLRTISAFSQYLLEDYYEKLDDDGKDYLNRINRASLRMQNLIDDLLRLSRIGTRHETLEKVYLSEVFEQIKEDMKARLENVDLRLPKTMPIIIANRTHMVELFSNLISNAIKYNDKPLKRIEIGWSQQGEFYKFYVRDNGIGIEEQYREKIFELFERLNPRGDDYESTGAGLTICKRIVEEYGGRIWVESKVGEGSTFYFTLPNPRFSQRFSGNGTTIHGAALAQSTLR